MSHDQSFFHLTPPQPDHVCITRRELAAQEHEEYLASLSHDEEAVMREEATALANVLYRALHAHCEATTTSYGAIIEALSFMQARVDLEMREDDDALNPEDCDA